MPPGTGLFIDFPERFPESLDLCPLIFRIRCTGFRPWSDYFIPLKPSTGERSRYIPHAAVYISEPLVTHMSIPDRHPDTLPCNQPCRVEHPWEYIMYPSSVYLNVLVHLRVNPVSSVLAPPG
jgi:hypothetical protein